MDSCLAGPFIAAEAAGKPEAAAALAQAWLAYLAASQARGGMQEPEFVGLAIKVQHGCCTAQILQCIRQHGEAAACQPCHNGMAVPTLLQNWTQAIVELV